jgi:hypothetical protein
MKQLLTAACILFFAAGCNNSTDNKDAKPSAGTGTAAAPAEKMDYPYTLSEPYKNWQSGDQKNVVTLLKSLKAFENSDIAACIAGFGDSAEVNFDGYHAKLSKDSLQKSFTQQRAGYKSLVIKMQDWEPVISEDKKEEWVTIWYKQIQTDQKGVTDSMNVIDDAKFMNGKIVTLNEYTQHFPAKK